MIPITSCRPGMEEALKPVVVRGGSDDSPSRGKYFLLDLAFRSENAHHHMCSELKTKNSHFLRA